MRLLTRLIALVLACAGASLVATPASAQATRTWVSGVGDDANPCSRTAPCKTFAGAISKTAAGGEINCLDPGGFGGVTIAKSINILCDAVAGGVLVMQTNGIVISAGPTDRVVLSGLDFFGAGNALAAVRVNSAGSVIVRNSTIMEFRGSGGVGILVQGAAQVVVDGCTIVHNTVGVSGTMTITDTNLITANGTDRVG